MGHSSLNGQHMDNVPLWIDNKPVQSGTTFSVINSTSQKTVWTASSASVELAQAAVESASKAFQPWAHTHPTERRRIFFKAAELFRSRRDEIIDIMVQETNCSRQWAAGINMHMGVEFLEELASLATSSCTGWLPTTETESRLALVFKVPYGVVLGIAPWNAPFILAIRAVATPIICGNTAVLKASELSPKTHNIIGQVFRDAGLPPGVLNIVQHCREDAAEVINAMISHPAVRKINFTGSTAVGRIIAQQAGRYLKPVLLELGGKASCIVLEDADLIKAAKAVVMGGFLHHGQICMATERVIVMRRVSEEFLKILRTEAEAFVAGNAVSTDGAKRTESLVEEAVEQGAHLEFGHAARLNASLQPTILSGVTKDMALFYTESFGPTISLTIVDTVDEAVSLANDSEYGLSASIFSQNIPKALRCAKRIETGACHINAMTIHDEPFLPHGGAKESGFGRFGGQWGMDEFLQVRTITILDEESNS
ncbi:Vanillin dehydrogenase [Fonsecaea pedrosoi]|nr:Vanillin dehydrogenase [Fonsecaea pedrosoi]